MKPFLLTCIICIYITSLLSQPVFNSADVTPNIGESALMHRDTVLTSFNVGSSGANVTWDFSGTYSTTTFTNTVIDPTTTSCSSSFTNAIYATNTIDGDHIMYSTIDASASYMIGTCTPSAGMIQYYSDPEKIMVFPFTYGTSFTDSLYCEYVSNTVPITRSGTVQITADGYGTLIMPDGTQVDNVLRVKMEENYTDDMNGMMTITYNNISYSWIKNGIFSSLFTWSEVNNTMFNSTTLAYLDASNLNVGDLDDNQAIRTYPNPATDIIHINLNSQKNENTEIDIINSNGQFVFKSIFCNQSEISLKTDKFTKGLYLIKIKTEKTVKTEKIFIQ